MASSQINTKSIARIATIQILYQFKENTTDSNIESLFLQIIAFYKDKDVKNDYELDNKNKLKLRPSYSYLVKLLKFTHNNLEEIDSIIESRLTKKWRLNTLPKLLLAILRVAICEIKFFPKTPRKVIINEYTDIASDMLDEREIGFVNSVLDTYSINRM